MSESTGAESAKGIRVIRHAWGYHVFLWTALPILGAAAGGIVAMVPGWVDRLAWVPFQGPIQLIDQITTSPWGLGALIAIGAIAGGVIALSAYDEMIKVTIRPEIVEIAGPGDAHWTSQRDKIAAVYSDGSDLVMTDSRGAEILRTTHDFNSGRFTEPFREMGYPWHDQDPHRDDYTRWVPGMRDLPERADAYLSARQTALEKNNSEEIAELNRELATLGVYVRNEKKRQYVRRVIV